MRSVAPLAFLLVACGTEPTAPSPTAPTRPPPVAVSSPPPSVEPAVELAAPAPVEPPPPPPIVLAETPTPLLFPARVEARLPEGFVGERPDSDHVLVGWEQRGTFDGAEVVLRVALAPAGPGGLVGETVGPLTLVAHEPPVADRGEWVGGALQLRQDGVELMLELRCTTEGSCGRSAELLRAIAGTFRMNDRLVTPRVSDDDDAREIQLAPGIRFATRGGDREFALATVDGRGTTLFVIRDGVEIIVSSFTERCERNRLPGRDVVTTDFGERTHELERMDEEMISWSLCEDLGPVQWGVDVTFDGEHPAEDEADLLEETRGWFLSVAEAEPPGAETTTTAETAASDAPPAESAASAPAPVEAPAPAVAPAPAEASPPAEALGAASAGHGD
jgi:hypothetical protein